MSRLAIDRTHSNMRYAAIASVLALGDLERFVYVLSVLERYTDQDCSLLLGRSLQEIEKTRHRALQYLAEVDSEGPVRRA